MLLTEVAPPPTSNYDRYIAAVRLANSQRPEEWAFKSDPGYQQVLEHVTLAHGERLLAWALSAEPNIDHDLLTRLARLNDSLGKPITYGYSPSNWRYLAHAIRAWQYIDSLGLASVDIVELGGGYGGMALYMGGLQHCYRTPLRRYTIVDLPEVARLQARYATSLALPHRAVNGHDLAALRDLMTTSATSFLISAYAFSEFDQQTRDWYAAWLVWWCEHGMMWWNFPEPVLGEDGREYGGPVYQFHIRPLTIEDDDPPIYAGHKIVRW